jgi:uncharacterized protein (DUF1800 family)
MPSPADISHLLRRTEFVARPGRVAELAAKASLADAVDDVLDVARNGTPAPPLTYNIASSHAVRIVEVTNSWLDRMAHESARPVQEKLALFWHGHFVSDDAKAGNTAVLKDQLDLYRRAGLGNLRDLAIAMATTVAMLRYLDNDKNFNDGPNQNFGRELMELFLLGVGNYTEDDVVSCSEAWTGHTVRSFADNTGTYEWHYFRHDESIKQFLGRAINAGSDTKQHGAETIEVILGDPATIGGHVPGGAPAREVAARFVSRKLWIYFAGTEPSGPLLDHLAATAISNNFNVRPWLRALLTHVEFYSPAVQQGLLRAPVDYVVALLAASGLRADPGNPFWLLEGMGQRLLFPPNVAGWGHNGYFVNASAFGQRAATARHVAYYVLADYWDGPGMHLRHGRLTRTDVWATGNDAANRQALVRRITELMGIVLGPTTLAALDEFAINAELHELHDLVELIFVSPEMSVA